MREWLRRIGGYLRYWFRTHRKVNPWTPGHGKLERFRALNRDFPTWEQTDTYRRLRQLEDTSGADLVVRVRVEG